MKGVFMYDTVKLRSPSLEDMQADIIDQALKTRQAVINATGEVLYSITSDELAGSWDHRIRVQLCRDEVVQEAFYPDAPPIPKTFAWHPDPEVNAERSRVAALSIAADPVIKETFRRPCAPYLIVEGSIHKAMLGHNITGGPQEFIPAARWFVRQIADRVACSLPDADEWIVQKVDVTECYRLSYEAIEEFIGSLNRAQYPRRERGSYGCHSLHFGGTTTAFKLYHKGVEFAKNDGKRLRQFLDPDGVQELQQLANGIMRLEISIKSKKLTEKFGEQPTVAEITDAVLASIHDHEVAKVIREGKTEDMRTVRKAKDVQYRLFHEAPISARLAGTLYGLWFRLSVLGEDDVRKDMAVSTFRRQRSQLERAGCSWAGTDIVIIHSCIPVGFSLRRSDSLRDTVEDPRITTMLAPYRQAA